MFSQNNSAYNEFNDLAPHFVISILVIFFSLWVSSNNHVEATIFIKLVILYPLHYQACILIIPVKLQNRL